jgi:DUF438 domain-containing protein
MAQATLNQILSQLETLDIKELHQLNQTIQKYLANKEEVAKLGAFHQALFDSGLIKQFK